MSPSNIDAGTLTPASTYGDVGLQHETDMGGTTRVQTYENRSGSIPGRLGAPGVHRVASGRPPRERGQSRISAARCGLRPRRA